MAAGRGVRPGLRAPLGIAVSAALLGWVFHGANLGAIRRRLAESHPGMLLATGFILTAGGMIRAARWRLLLEPLGAPTSLRARWAALNIGFMATNLFPARVGEVVRPLALSRMAPVSMAAALGTVVLERILDTVVILGLALAVMASRAVPGGATVFGTPVAYIVSVSALMACAALALIALAGFRPGALVRLSRSALACFPGGLADAVARRIEALLSGLLSVRRPGTMARAVLWTLVLWLWMGSAFWAAFRAFDIPLGFPAAMFTECTLSLFEALPAGPGFVGSMQAGVLASVHGVFGVAADPTLSMAIGYFVAGFVPVTVIGLYYAWTLGLRPGSIAL